MRIVKRIMIFPIVILVAIMSTCMKLIVKAETYIAGVGIIFITACVVNVVIRHMWMQLGILAVIMFVAFMVMILSVKLDIWMEDMLATLKKL